MFSTMNEQPLVSVIMNCFNSEKYLKDAIDSVYAQGFGDWEIIFWDNISSDKSADIANSYDARLRYFLAPEHTELGVARNLALSQAKGKYVAFLDCDDLYIENKLQSQIAFMERGKYCMSYGSVIIINDNGKELKKRVVKNESGDVFGKLLKHYEISMLSVVIKRSLLIKEKLNFDINLKFNPDFNLFMKIAAKYPVGVIRPPIGKYRILDNSLSSRTVSIAPDEIKYTLDELFCSSSQLRNNYADGFKAAYQKLSYYRTVTALYNRNRKQALKLLYPIINARIEYFIVFILISFFVPFKIILKILGR
jgi:glycosyltransferase involved in cell wall biosynthesis